MSSIEFRKDLFADERDDNLNEIGKPKLRQDIEGHVRGRTAYYDDHLFDGLQHMRCVRSPHHHARVRSIDSSAAERMEGVRRVVRAADVPHNINTLLSLIGFGRDDEQLIADRKVAYKGEPVLAVIAESEAQARAACAAVRVDWEVLPHVLDVEDALKPGAPVVNEEYPNNCFDYEPYDHVKLRFGDVEAGFAQADKIVEATYEMSPIEQAPIETCGAIAAPETSGRYVCHTGTQALFFSLGTTAKLLDMPSSKLHFIGGTVGGGFGGKVDSLTEPMAVLGAVLTGQPVKFQWDREEEMQVGAPRGAERWKIKDGVRADGRIVARQFTGFFDAGAYTRLSSYAGTKGTGHLPGPYSIPNVASNVFCVYTNRTPATAMRGFGITGVDFAIECHMDRVAEAVGVDPISLRIRNAYRDGDMKAHRRKAKNCALVECCQVAAGKAGWRLAPEDAAANSRAGSSAERQAIPETALDQEGLVGARKLGQVAATDPARGTKRLPAGTHGRDHKAVPVQRPDMQQLAERVGHRIAQEHGEAPAAAAPAPASAQNSSSPARAPETAAPPSAPSHPAAAPAPPAAAPTVNPSSQPQAPQRSTQQPKPYEPDKTLQPGRPPPRCVAVPLGIEEALMAIHSGRGFACINYPIGMNLGGDPAQALVHSTPDGKFMVTLSAIDLGQGMKSVTRQIAAEALGVPLEDVYVDTADSDTGPHDMGSFASRGTHRVGNAVIRAASEARAQMMEAAADELEVSATDLDTDGRGNIHVKGAPSRAITVAETAIAAQFKQGKTLSGRGIFLVEPSGVDPDTGEMSPVTAYAHAALVIDLTVDDETGEVEVTEINSAYEVGRALNPKLVEQQLIGGAWMGVSHALYETTEPYYPDRAHGPEDFNSYLMPGPGEVVPHNIAVLERPAEDAPYGGKGPGEMCANPVLPAIANAVYNAVGVRVDKLPITPEKILRGIEANGGAAPQGRPGT